jgi:hypothetical protein
MECGTAHISLLEAVETGIDEINEVVWYKVTAQIPYPLINMATNERHVDKGEYEISVGLPSDRRKKVYTALALNQGPPWSKTKPLDRDTHRETGEPNPEPNALI